MLIGGAFWTLQLHNDPYLFDSLASQLALIDLVLSQRLAPRFHLHLREELMCDLDALNNVNALAAVSSSPLHELYYDDALWDHRAAAVFV